MNRSTLRVRRVEQSSQPIYHRFRTYTLGRNSNDRSSVVFVAKRVNQGQFSYYIGQQVFLSHLNGDGRHFLTQWYSRLSRVDTKTIPDENEQCITLLRRSYYVSDAFRHFTSGVKHRGWTLVRLRGTMR